MSGSPPSRRLSVVLGLLVACSFAAELLAEYRGPRWQVYLFKPLTTAAIIVFAAIAPGTWRPQYRRAVVAGLVFSLAGDVFLMLPGDRFVPGLAAFLVAHLCFISAFARTPGLEASPRFTASYGAWYLLLITVLRPHVDPMLWLAVVVYGLALTIMAWLAAERWSALGGPAAASAALGGALFVASDSVLALNRFVVPFRAARIVIMASYVAAIWLIARSVAGNAPAVEPNAGA